MEEVKVRRDYLPEDSVIETIYWGGGTPSLLEEEEINRLMQAIRTAWTVDPQAEITLEANPDDITAEKAAAWQNAGINRISMGVQSFFEEDLVRMNRAHNAQQARAAVPLLQKAGFENITLDLIYGIQDLSDERWKANVDLALQLQVPHLSCYALTVEPKTALDKRIRDHREKAVNPDDQARQLLLLMDWLEAAGYEHYEISNFARPGYRSRHNSAYWQGKHFIGLGPSAHSYNGKSRQWNIANNTLYISSTLQGMPSFEKEELGPIQQFNEYVMTSLRTKEGIDLAIMQQLHPTGKTGLFMKEADRYLKQQLMEEREGHLLLTRQGKLFADGIAADLFIL